MMTAFIANNCIDGKEKESATSDFAYSSKHSAYHVDKITLSRHAKRVTFAYEGTQAVVFPLFNVTTFQGW
jgi:hypothetical protein